MSLASCLVVIKHIETNTVLIVANSTLTKPLGKYGWGKIQRAPGKMESFIVMDEVIAK